MSPEPFVTSQCDDPTPRTELAWCQDCQRHHWDGLGHVCDPLAPARGIVNAVICSMVIIAALAALAVLFVGRSDARPTKNPEPIAIPAAHAKARAECPSLLECRASLIHALEAIEWQRSENLKLAREMVGKVDDWTCIHQHEGAWNDTRDPYWGGLQMDRGFMGTYGRDMIKRHHGGLADTWTPREQIIVAQRAFVQGRGYAPWPETSRACGLR